MLEFYMFTDRLQLISFIRVVLLIVFGRKRLPMMAEALRQSIHSVRDSLFEDAQQFRPEVPTQVDCDRCRAGFGLRYRSCGRLTKKSAYVILGGLALLAVVAVWWHVSVPVL
jgi:hypothetical protein